MPTHLEYILFNLVVLMGPVLLSFDRHLRFIRQWRHALLSILPVMALFIIWDWLVTDRHWWFNPVYTAGTFIGALPLGEWLFFLSVPFASLFVWDVLRHYRPRGALPGAGIHPLWLTLGLAPALIFACLGKEYTALVFFAFTNAAWYDLTRGGRVLTRPNILWYVAILTGLMFVFNGYLTARPVVLYQAQYQLDIRIFTIPLEDFFYGYSLILGCTSIYEKYRRNHA